MNFQGMANLGFKVIINILYGQTKVLFTSISQILMPKEYWVPSKFVLYKSLNILKVLAKISICLQHILSVLILNNSNSIQNFGKPQTFTFYLYPPFRESEIFPVSPIGTLKDKMNDGPQSLWTTFTEMFIGGKSSFQQIMAVILRLTSADKGQLLEECKGCQSFSQGKSFLANSHQKTGMVITGLKWVKKDRENISNKSRKVPLAQKHFLSILFFSIQNI